MAYISGSKAAALAVAAMLLSACSVTVTEQMIVSPSSDIDPDNLALLTGQSGYQESFTATESGEQLHTLTLEREPNQPTILVLHGNALNMTLQPWFGLLQSLAELNYNIIAIDYQGFGLSSGDASFSAMRDDASSIINALPAESDVIVYGLSLGSVMAMDISQEPRVQGIVLEGAVTTDSEMIEVFRQRNTLGRLASVDVDQAISFDNTSAVSLLNKPLLVIHGENDSNIPVSMGEQLYAASNHPGSQLYIVEDGTHADTFHVAPERFQRELSKFIASLSSYN
ncbi:hypothetical protein CWE12_00065 [Aliidiomarina sedimenti]|uniref:Serine aminopeptidase S33 domain-containing protein n=1 Tax=Aliidiomarina sedimenti TaxID=1933879 RepID=A0ABY0C1T1_9GAMM|nr:alpha/beta hydrolase [Aliidiomarina sedimenti]RUO31435.1 hypothetical protein CWE12_00065 [Aliidiomarina sedimenti]